MLNINKQVFNAILVSLLVAAPVLAANDTSANGADGGSGRMIAQNKVEGGGGSFHRPGMRLSDSQLEKIASLKNQYLDKTGGERTELGSLHRQLKEVLSQSSIDRSKAEAIQAKINSLKGELSTAKLDLRIDEISTMTPEQREQMHHHMLVAEAFGGGHHHHFGGRREHGGGHFEHGGGHSEHGGGRQDKA
jgi:Spy/CpxP family protein refolding chaperone